MEDVQRDSRRFARLLGRGRDEATPFYLNVVVLLVVAAAVGIVVGITFAVYELA